MAFRHLLVPTDFSEPANHALRYAMEEATLHNAKVTLLHVPPSDTETEVYYVSGAQAAGAGMDLVSGGRLVTPPPPEPTVVRRDFSDEALTKLTTSCRRRAKDLAGRARRRDVPQTRSCASPKSTMSICL